MDADTTQLVQSLELVRRLMAWPDVALAGFLRDHFDLTGPLTDRDGPEELDEVWLEELQVLHTGLFITGAPKARCLPYESAWRKDLPVEKLLSELAELYRTEGYLPSFEEEERPDHLIAELGFLAGLAARSPGRAREFHLEHLSRWWPAFHRAVQGQTSGPSLYRQITNLLNDELARFEKWQS